jgi:hypothetical protein
VKRENGKIEKKREERKWEDREERKPEKEKIGKST